MKHPLKNERMLKIGFVLSKTPQYSETFFVSKLNGLIKNNFKVYLFVNKYEENNLLSKEIKIIRQNKIFKNRFKTIFKLLYTLNILLIFHANKVLKYWRLIGHKSSIINFTKRLYVDYHIISAKKLDFLHFGFLSVCLGREYLAKVLSSKMTCSIRGYDITVVPLKNKFCYNDTWKNIDKVHTISDDLLNIAFKLGLSRSVKHDKITPAIDYCFFSNNSEKKFDRNLITFTTIGRLHWSKGYDYSLMALSKLKKLGYKFKYNIIGWGDSSYIERYKYMIDELNLSKEVSMLGKLNKKEIKKKLKDCDIYLQYSVKEGFCNATLEAQSMGLLCIVSSAEGLSENVVNNKTGWVVDKRNSNKLLNKIVEVINLHDTKKNKIRNAATSRISKEFTLKKQEQKFIDFFHSK